MPTSKMAPSSSSSSWTRTSLPHKPLDPTIRLNLDLADGRTFEKLVTFDPAVWSSAKDHADVRIGDNRFTGDLHTYRITATVDDISVDVMLEGEVPAWRPETGYMLFGEDRQHEFSWLPSVPQGKVTATYSIGDERHETTGTGYHDHNWGNVGLMEIVHDWYWARGQAGPYSVIASYITAHEKYDYAAIPIFMLARDGVLIGDDPSRLTFEALGPYTDSVTGKPVANITRYTYGTNDERYVVTFTRHKDLARNRMIESLTGSSVPPRSSSGSMAPTGVSRARSASSTTTAPRSSISTSPRTRSGSSCTSATPGSDVGEASA
jgi:hypothetical protein